MLWLSLDCEQVFLVAAVHINDVPGQAALGDIFQEGLGRELLNVEHTVSFVPRRMTPIDVLPV